MRDVTKLDRKRPYGTVTGDPLIAFIQENRKYRFDGTLIDDGYTPTVVDTPPVEEIKKELTQAERNQIRSEKMKQIWAQRKSQEAPHLDTEME